MKHKPKHAAPRPTAALWRWMIVFALLAALIVGLIVLQVGGAQSQKQREQFASDRGGDKKDVKPVKIDGKRTMGYLEAVCKIGPRISGSEGMKKQQELIEKHFTDLDGKVRYQKFSAKQRGRKAIDMANMIVSYHPDRARRVIICSHYDTRPIADEEDDKRQWTKPFVSANDGGSGVALLMELAHHVKDLDTSVGIDFVLFDGEEYVFDKEDTYFFGSRHFAKEYAKIKKKTTYLGAILLDMIGGKTARFPVEQNSAFKAGKLTKEVWEIAAELKCNRFKNEYSRTEILDDHIPLNAGGIPAIDIIDFDYPHWHKLTDLPKNCSAEPMEQVAKVLTVWIQRQK